MKQHSPSQLQAECDQLHARGRNAFDSLVDLLDPTDLQTPEVAVAGIATGIAHRASTCDHAECLRDSIRTLCETLAGAAVDAAARKQWESDPSNA